MSHQPNSQPVTPFTDVIFVVGSPDEANEFWPVADDQCRGSGAPLALRAEMATLQTQIDAANVDIHCHFVGSLFRGERRFCVPGQAHEWRFFHLADDPLWLDPLGFPLPDATRAELVRVAQAVPALFAGRYELYTAHLVKVKPESVTAQSTWEELAPGASQQMVTASTQLGRLADKALRLAAAPYVGAVVTVTAAAGVGVAATALSAVAVSVAAVATVGAVGSLAALDPILFLARVANGRPLILGEIAAFYPLAKWVYA